MSADGLTDLMGPAEASDLATGIHVSDLPLAAPSAAPQPMALAKRSLAPELQSSAPTLQSARQ